MVGSRENVVYSLQTLTLSPDLMLKGCDYTHFHWISHDALLPHQIISYPDLNKTKTLYFYLTNPQFLA
jgi:coproporphyrinogen III oxidase